MGLIHQQYLQDGIEFGNFTAKGGIRTNISTQPAEDELETALPETTDLFISSDPMLPRNADISDIVTVRRVPFSTASFLESKSEKIVSENHATAGHADHGGNASEVILFFYC